jgi:hypothetical protein
MRISGHKTRAIFDRYNIVSERDLRDAALKLERKSAAADETKTGESPKQSARSETQECRSTSSGR